MNSATVDSAAGLPETLASPRKRKMSALSQPTRKKRHIVEDVEDDEEEQEAPVETVPVVSISESKAKDADAQPQAAPSVSDLALLTTALEDFRTLVTCKVCFRLLYEPWTIACGHTYCYSCIRNWFNKDTHGPNICPECRTEVTMMPAPAYLVRELTQKLISKTEFLPEDETAEQHAELQREEAAILEEDRQKSTDPKEGLFGGTFRKNRVRVRRVPLIDIEDNVLRCPSCGWELEDGQCFRCGPLESEDEGSDYEDYDEEGEENLESNSATNSASSERSFRMDADMSGGSDDLLEINVLREELSSPSHDRPPLPLYRRNFTIMANQPWMATSRGRYGTTRHVGSAPIEINSEDSGEGEGDSEMDSFIVGDDEMDEDRHRHRDADEDEDDEDEDLASEHDEELDEEDRDDIDEGIVATWLSSPGSSSAAVSAQGDDEEGQEDDYDNNEINHGHLQNVFRGYRSRVILDESDEEDEQ